MMVASNHHSLARTWESEISRKMMAAAVEQMATANRDLLTQIDTAASKIHLMFIQHGRESQEYLAAVQNYQDAVGDYYRITRPPLDQSAEKF